MNQIISRFYLKQFHEKSDKTLKDITQKQTERCTRYSCALLLHFHHSFWGRWTFAGAEARRLRLQAGRGDVSGPQPTGHHPPSSSALTAVYRHSTRVCGGNQKRLLKRFQHLHASVWISVVWSLLSIRVSAYTFRYILYFTVSFSLKLEMKPEHFLVLLLQNKSF